MRPVTVREPGNQPSQYTVTGHRRQRLDRCRTAFEQVAQGREHLGAIEIERRIGQGQSHLAQGIRAQPTNARLR